MSVKINRLNRFKLLTNWELDPKDNLVYNCFVRKEKKSGHTTKKDVIKHPGKKLPWWKKIQIFFKNKHFPWALA